MKSCILIFLLLGIFKDVASSSCTSAVTTATSISSPPSLTPKKRQAQPWTTSSPLLHTDTQNSQRVITKTPRGGNSKMSNFLQRAPPAILMLLLTYILVSKTGATGIIGLVLLLQVGMYNETTSIIEEYHYTINAEPRVSKLGEVVEKWWWFLTVLSGTSVKNILLGDTILKDLMVSEKLLDLITYGMGAVGLLVAVVGMASHVSAGPDMFRNYLGKVAASHFALLFLIGQSSFWIKTVQEYGILWIIYPALLVIINDTMAYVFGVLLGNHKLLPRLSPKKTVEGFVGAAFSTFAASIPLLKAMGGADLSNLKQHAVAMAVFTSIVAPFGGFLASAVKRAHGAKDFGTLIPGHGGVVDRFDCQIVTAPFVYLYLQQFL
mmetsp:Transcript_17341/g.25853  ORF Transcript_17341/g.25853 Transcript_17341/m.25853 type:complete len:378 (+) Transcript_17341:147-1280(+)